MVLDNAAFHHAKRLVIPDNIILLFLPPYAPKLNPAEKVWWMIKRELKMRHFKDMDALQQALNETVKKVYTQDYIKRLTAYATYQNIIQINL